MSFDAQAAKALLEIGLALCGALVCIGLVLLVPPALRGRISQAEREAVFLDGALNDSRHYASGQGANASDFDHFTGTLDEFIAAGGLRSEPQA